MKKGIRLLNIVQFLAALNDNLVRMLCAFFIISIIGADEASNIVTKTGTLFLLPFLIFSTLGGLLADKFSKSTIIKLTRFLELIAFILFFLAVVSKSIPGSYVMLFLLATISAIFSPSKYSIIPEYVTKKRLLAANSLISAFTFLGIIFGTGLASFLVEITNRHFVAAAGFAVCIALLNLILSFSLPRSEPQNSKKQINAFYIKEFFFSIIEMRRTPDLLPATFSFAYFLFVGSFMQLNILPFSIENLGLSALMGGYLFTITAIGLAIGAGVTAIILHNRINLRIVPYAGLAISVCLVGMSLLTSSIYFTVFFLLLLGVFAGIFLIPPTTYVLSASPDKTRGRNFSTANLLSFLFALMAPGAIYCLNVLIDFTAATSFIIIAAFNVVVMICLLRAFKKNQKATP